LTIPPAVAWANGRVRLLDQRALPARLTYRSCASVGELIAAVKDLTVRGAPSLGAVGAYGVALAARTESSPAAVRRAAARLARARPTAVNLAWGVEAVLPAFALEGAAGALAEARIVVAEIVAANKAIGRHGAALLPRGSRVLTHCNAGALAAVEYGTALGVVRAGAERGCVAMVWVDETRPVFQGARLTAWELDRLGIPHTVIPDGAAGSLFAAGEVDAVIVGADRIAANGDVANKIGTYPLAVLARAHRVPFYVAAPWSTIDLATANAAAMVIEQRNPDEVHRAGGQRMTPCSSVAWNPAFDVTPAKLVTALITERGVIGRPTRARLRAATRPPA
jgi:methylthioribose-1-phosphate isomerase